MNNAEQREAATKFYNDWRGIGNEKSDSQRFWIEFFSNVLGIEDVTKKIIFEKRVVVDGQTKFIDVYIPETRVLIEQKSIDKDLSKKVQQSDGTMRTPFEQGRNYAQWMIPNETPLWIVACNFKTFEIHDMNKPNEPVTVITLEEVRNKLPLFDFMFKKEVKELTREMEISVKAGEIVGLLYDKLIAQYKEPDEQSFKSLNALCVRLVFCLYAEDAGIFGSHMMFHDYLKDIPVNGFRKALVELFKILDTKPEDRDKYLEEDNPRLAAFPYVNGGLFADETIEIPPFTEEIKNLLLNKASADFDWSDISPTIFGAVFESTLNPETRRSGGMHYTSVENIHKVIDPLFMDGLRAEFDEIKGIAVERTKKAKLNAFQTKLARLKFLDPACGSGNFLTETYISMRRLENEVLYELQSGQIVLGDAINPIQVSISQFYGIEINDFAVTVAKTALWIAESQMMKETEDIVHMSLDFLPLKSYANIVEGNAMAFEWNNVIHKSELNYIMGNPPFSAGRRMGAAQRQDMNNVAKEFPKNGDLDYVSLWYIKAARYMQGTNIRAGFVSTSSITQGEQVVLLWKILFGKYSLDIFYAIRSFNWESEAKNKAGVHCVIILFTIGQQVQKKCIVEDKQKSPATHINGYLLDAPDLWIDGQKKPICDVPLISNGSKPLDNAICAFTPDEKAAFIKQEPKSEPYFYKYMGSKEFINNIERWFLIINRIPPNELSHMPLVLEKLKEIREYRLSSSSIQTYKLAELPAKFHFENIPEREYLVIPQTSSGRRRYVPIGFLTPDVMVNNKLQVMRDGGLYEFGILSSNVHNAWLRAVAGRLREDFTYSVSIVYNTFPWPETNEDTKEKIRTTAQRILDVRNKYTESSLADLYGDLTMPIDLRQAHIENDKAVMRAYGFSIKDTTETQCVAELMKRYQALIEK